MSDKFALYFSHSWRPGHVNLNLYIWNLVKDRCNLLMDVSDESSNNPPYIINRIEELLRRSDLFLCVLPFRDNKSAGGAGPATLGDANLKCSPYSLFEIRLAERANRPRLIIYDYRTKFQKPPNPPLNALYLSLSFESSQSALEPKIKEVMDHWLDWADYNMSPQNYQPSLQSLIFLPNDIPRRDEAIEHIEQALETTYNLKPLEIKENVANDAELFRLLAGGGLLVSELSNFNSLSIYSVAHAMFVPSVRLLHQSDQAAVEPVLPWLLQGHPRGYQEDLVKWKEPAQLTEAVKTHAEAMLASERVITNFDEGKRLFESRRYIKHRVFLSHNLPLGQRTLVDLTLKGLKDVSIEVFEYAVENRAGEDWKKRLESELAKATHFVLFLTDGYEQSPACVDEIKHVLLRRNQVQIIPFFVNERNRPLVEINDMNHKPLVGDLDSNVATIIQQVTNALLCPL